jgi:hypothetical protein
LSEEHALGLSTLRWVWVVTVDSGLGRCIGNFHKLLSEILAGKKAEQRFWRILEANRYVLLVHETAVPLPASQRFEGLARDNQAR